MPTSVALAGAFIAFIAWVLLEYRASQRTSIYDWDDPEAMSAEEREWRIG